MKSRAEERPPSLLLNQVNLTRNDSVQRTAFAKQESSHGIQALAFARDRWIDAAGRDADTAAEQCVMLIVLTQK